ncbi:MAG: histidinol-phosphatase [Clostridia bacterium]|nr:histidinol-phosphatase [Clostridia bacterium]
MKHNFHTHTTRCKHAVGTDEQYVKAALDSGFDVLGFADHAPWAFATDYVSHCRMPADQWQDYKRSVLSLKEKYQGQISIRLGLECEYYPKYIDQLYRLRDDGCEYFLLGNHFLFTEESFPYTGTSCTDDDELRRYAEQAAEAVATGLYGCVAHPDLYMMYRTELSPACMEAADMICQAAREAEIPIEYNLLGLQGELSGHSRGYPNQDFWQYVRKWDNKVILGIDAHDPEQLRSQPVWDIALERLHAMGHRLVNQIR